MGNKLWGGRRNSIQGPLLLGFEFLLQRIARLLERVVHSRLLLDNRDLHGQRFHMQLLSTVRLRVHFGRLL